MSDGDRGKQSRPWLKTWLSAALLFALTLIGWAGFVQSGYAEQAAHNSSYYEEWANNEIRRGCTDPTLPAISYCISEHRAAAERDKRAEQDLYAQRVMALWTSIMGAMAALGIALSGIGVYLIWGTWKQTGEAAESARNTLRSYVAKERAILVPQGARHSTRLDEAADGFIVDLFNGGLSPATLIMTQWAYISRPLWPARFDSFDNNKRTILPEGEGRTPFLGRGEVELVGETYLVGVVRYQTLESEKFETPFAFHLRHILDDGYQPDRWECSAWYVEGMPDHT